MSLRQLLREPGIWRGRGGPSPARAEALGTGCPALDRRLPGHGWPAGALAEILCTHEGAGELSLVLPGLRRLAATGRRIVLVAPPHVPYPPALERHGLGTASLVWVDVPPDEAAWAAEQALRSGACGAVLCWLVRADDRALRRLQLATEQGRCRGFVFRPASALKRPSPAALRLRVAPWGELELVKCRGTFAKPETFRLTAPGSSSRQRPAAAAAAGPDGGTAP